MWHSRRTTPFVAFLVALGFQVSGLESVPIAVILWSIAGGLVLWMWGWPVARELRLQSPIVKRAPTSEPESAPDPSSDTTFTRQPALPIKPFRFEDRALLLDRPRIDLSELFDKQSASFKITFNVRNVSGYPVEITDLVGEIRLNLHEEEPETCRASRRFGAPMRLDTYTYRSLEIIQPVPSDLRDLLTRVLLSKVRWVQFSFGFTWVGSVEGPSGREALANCAFRAEPLHVLGPLRDAAAAHRVQAWSSILADSKVYNNRGQPSQQ